MTRDEEYAESTDAMRGMLIGGGISAFCWTAALAGLFNYQHILNWLGL